MAYFYITNYNRLTNPKLFRSYMFNEYNAIKLKRQRLKINALKFTFFEFRYNNIVLFYDVRILYKDLSDTRHTKSIFERTMDFFKWQWDVANIVTLSFYVSLCYDVLAKFYEVIEKESEKLSKEESELQTFTLRNIYNLIDCDEHLTHPVVMRMMPKLADIILKVTDSQDVFNLLTINTF
jgi:hypothetical protein